MSLLIIAIALAGFVDGLTEEIARVKFFRIGVSVLLIQVIVTEFVP